jgi:hypothetical protein
MILVGHAANSDWYGSPKIQWQHLVFPPPFELLLGKFIIKIQYFLLEEQF